jgi:hypothetical protein
LNEDEPSIFNLPEPDISPIDSKPLEPIYIPDEAEKPTEQLTVEPSSNKVVEAANLPSSHLTTLFEVLLETWSLKLSKSSGLGISSIIPSKLIPSRYSTLRFLTIVLEDTLNGAEPVSTVDSNVFAFKSPISNDKVGVVVELSTVPVIPLSLLLLNIKSVTVPYPGIS